MKCIITSYEFWSIILTLGAIITPIVIYKKNLKVQDQEKKCSLRESARLFVFDNNDIHDYLLLCMMASVLNKSGKFYRPIYKEFTRLSTDLQREVIKQCEYKIDLVDRCDWIDEALQYVNKYINDKDIGNGNNNYLYEGAKYFHMAIDEYYMEEYDCKCIERNYKDYFSVNGMFSDIKLDFKNYCAEYIQFVVEQKDPLILISNPPKPIEYLEGVEHLRSVSDKDVCYWVLHFVGIISSIIIDKIGNKDDDILYYSCGNIETYEDKYYDVAINLYRIYLLLKKQHDEVGYSKSSGE